MNVPAPRDLRLVFPAATADLRPRLTGAPGAVAGGGAAEHAIPLKLVTDATRLRNRLE